MSPSVLACKGIPCARLHYSQWLSSPARHRDVVLRNYCFPERGGLLPLLLLALAKG